MLNRFFGRNKSKPETEVDHTPARSGPCLMVAFRENGLYERLLSAEVLEQCFGSQFGDVKVLSCPAGTDPRAMQEELQSKLGDAKSVVALTDQSSANVVGQLGFPFAGTVERAPRTIDQLMARVAEEAYWNSTDDILGSALDSASNTFVALFAQGLAEVQPKHIYILPPALEEHVPFYGRNGNALWQALGDLEIYRDDKLSKWHGDPNLSERIGEVKTPAAHLKEWLIRAGAQASQITIVSSFSDFDSEHAKSEDSNFWVLADRHFMSEGGKGSQDQGELHLSIVRRKLMKWLGCTDRPEDLNHLACFIDRSLLRLPLENLLSTFGERGWLRELSHSHIVAGSDLERRLQWKLLDRIDEQLKSLLPGS